MPLKISSSPHLKTRRTVPFIMSQVIFALVPAITASILFFGTKAVFLILNCIITSVITEVIILKVRKKPSVIKDFSAVLTGLLLALILPPGTKWYAATLGSIFAILVGKHLFGGLGSNIFNPALIGRAFLVAAYPKMLTTFQLPKAFANFAVNSVDALSAATPLALRKFSHTITPSIDLFFGNVAGSIGETSALCLIIGGIYLIIRKIADWRITVSILTTIVLISAIGYLLNPLNGSIMFHLFSGGLLIGILFMATDPVTSPITKTGRYIFGVSVAAIIMIIRYFSGLPEGVMYSILFMNAFTPLINRYTRPRRFGE